MCKSRGCTVLAMFYFIPWKQIHKKECSGNTVRAQGTWLGQSEHRGHGWVDSHL